MSLIQSAVLHPCPQCNRFTACNGNKKKNSYFVRTIETASLRMLSPNTSMLSTGSTLRALNIAIVATGSTAEIKEPKAKLSKKKKKKEAGKL